MFFLATETDIGRSKNSPEVSHKQLLKDHQGEHAHVLDACDLSHGMEPNNIEHGGINQSDVQHLLRGDRSRSGPRQLSAEESILQR